MNKRKTFQVKRMAVAVSMAVTAFATVQYAHAGAGWGDSSNAAASASKSSTDSLGNVKVRTFWANSPQGDQADALTGSARPTGTALRKFVDALPGLQIATADQSAYAGSDYYEIAVVEYAQRMHSDLAKPTTLRGYVQIDPLATDTAGGSTSTGSAGVALFQLDGSPVMISRPNGTGGFVQRQAFAFASPAYLGATIVATRGRPTRIKFYNGLPAGYSGEFTWQVNADGTATKVATPGVWHRNGDLFIPVDHTNPGGGDGPNPTGTRNILCGDTLAGPNNDPILTNSFCGLDALGNPIPGQTQGYQTATAYEQFTENREELHLHGGDNAWISDGHPHQWIAPSADELGSTGLSAEYRRGELAYNVPDMPEPGPGAMTYYYPNGQSGRLMFYHDHASGLTRLNVYAGTAAGYVLVDGAENALFAAALNESAGVPAEGIPLVIQDKTFVPKDIATQDALWNADGNYQPLTTSSGAQYFPWGQEGDLWFSHVYETNQDPLSADGTNPVGRWDGASFFWPVFPQAYATPDGSYGNASLTPESFMDTPIVNGMAYPTMTVEPKAYRFRILGVGNDRMLNLSWFVADSSVTTSDGRTNTEVKMVPFNSPNSNTAVTYTCPDGTTGALGTANANGTIGQLGWTESGPNASGVTLYADSFPCAGGVIGTGWGQSDNRAGGVPDPKTMGPHWLRVGNEAGLLAQPVDIPPTPTNYEYNKRSVTVLNVLERALWLGPAERADVIVDFAPYAGKTLILYNDSAAPVPAGDPRIDYYTGNGDQTGAGGAPTTVAGFGPNTRTVMQVVVGTNVPLSGTQAFASTVGTPYVPAVPANATTGTPAVAAVPATGFYANAIAAYNATHDKPVVPTAEYQPNTATGSAWSFATAASSTDPIAPLEHIYTGAIYLNRYQGLSFTAPEAISYTPAPNCSTTANCLTALAAIRANGNGLTTAQPGTQVKAYVESKAIQELFEADYGRMNATLGVELPFTNVNIQTTIPLAYVDPATETITNGETQFWKITHNGVDSHPVHFHLLNVQVINRVGWDGTIKPIPADEAGWKETVKMHPLEDIIVAVRAKTPATPFGMPHSYRKLSPAEVVGDQHGFTQIDPVTGNAPTATSPNAVLQANGSYAYQNTWVDYASEYVWHCHILGHEENDFMRPFIFKANETKSAAPSGVTASVNGAVVTVGWTDPTPFATLVPGAPDNEIGFRVERSTDGVNFTALAAGSRTYNAKTNTVNALANSTSYTDTVAGGPTPAQPVAPTNAGQTATTVTLGLPAVQNAVDTFRIVRNGAVVATGVTGSTWTDNAPLPGVSAYNLIESAPSAAGTYSYQVVAVTAAGDSPVAGPVTATVAAADNVSGQSATLNVLMAPAVVTGITVSNPSANSLQVNWAAAPANGQVTGYTVFQGANPVATCTNVTGTSCVVPSLADNTSYAFTVVAINAGGTGAASASASGLTLPAAATSLTGVPSANAVSLSWTAPTNAASLTYTVQYSANGGTTWTSAPAVAATSTTVSGLNAATTYQFRVVSNNASGSSAASSVFSTTTLAVAPTSLAVTNPTPSSLQLSWAAVTGATSYIVNEAANATMTGAAVLLNQASPDLVSGLSANTAYYFTVQAVDAGGNSSASAVVSGLTLPAAPAALTVGTVTQSSVALSWTAPSGTGVLTYTIQYSGAATGTVTGITGTSTTVTVPVPGSYAFTVTAVNASGASVASAPVTAQTMIVPSVPTCCTVDPATLTATSLNLSWVASATGPATSYNVQRATNATFTRGLTTYLNDTATSLAVTGLAQNTTYYFRVQAVNAVGSSTYSANTFSVTTPGLPVAPGAATAAASAVSTAAPTITLTLPAMAAGVTSFTVYQQSRVNGGVAWGAATQVATGVTGATWTTAALTPAMQYRYYLVAVGPTGSSTNGANSNTVTVQQLPNAPSGVTATPVAGATPGVGTRTVNLAWTLGAPDGATVTAVRVLRSTSASVGANGLLNAGVTTTNLAATATAATVNGLARNTTYYFQIVEVTAGGSNAAAPVAATTAP